MIIKKNQVIRRTSLKISCILCLIGSKFLDLAYLRSSNPLQNTSVQHNIPDRIPSNLVWTNTISRYICLAFFWKTRLTFRCFYVSSTCNNTEGKEPTQKALTLCFRIYNSNFKKKQKKNPKQQKTSTKAFLPETFEHSCTSGGSTKHVPY